MKKVRYFIPFIALALLFSCAGIQGIPDTPEGRGLIAMDTYYGLKATYEREVAMPNLSEEYKDILEYKREALIGLYFSVKMYNEYVDLGFVSAKTLNDVYTKYINIAEFPFLDLAYIYEEYMKTGELDYVMLELVIDVMIAELSARALSKLM